MGLIHILDVAWVVVLGVSFVYMVVSASRARRALEGLAVGERRKALFGSTTPHLTGDQRFKVRRSQLALICFLILLIVPPFLLRAALQGQLSDAELQNGEVKTAAERSAVFAEARLHPVELVAGGFGIRVEGVSDSGLLNEAGVRSSETIVSIDGDRLATMADAAQGILAIGANRFSSLRIRDSNGNERTVSR